MSIVLRCKTLFSSLLWVVLGMTLMTSCGGYRDKHIYKVAFDPAWFGLELLGQENTISGFSQDLLKEVAKIGKIQITLLYANKDHLVEDLKTKTYDAILSSIYPYLFNLTYFDFSDPYLLTGPVLVTPFSSKISSIDKLDGKEIAILPNTNGSLYLEKNPAILIREYGSIPDALNGIVEGSLDGAVFDILIARAYCRNIYQGKLRVAGDPFNDAGLRLLTLENSSPHLLQIFNKALRELKKSGKYDTLLKKWSLDV